MLIQDLSSIVRDHYNYVIDIMASLIDRCADLMRESTIIHMLMLCEILINKNVQNVRYIFL
jgi:hypothetical protein